MFARYGSGRAGIITTKSWFGAVDSPWKKWALRNLLGFRRPPFRPTPSPVCPHAAAGGVAPRRAPAGREKGPVGVSGTGCGAAEKASKLYHEDAH